MTCITIYCGSCVYNPTKVVEDLKAKLQEVLQDCGEYSNQFTPSYIVHYTDSITAIPEKPDSSFLVTTGHIHELSTTTYNEVCFPSVVYLALGM